MRSRRPCVPGRTILALASILLVPISAGAQSVSGQATSVLATVAGVTTSIGSTGWLSGPGDALGSSSLSAPLSYLGSVESLEAATISAQDVSSLASVANLVLSVATSRISAAFLLASVRAPTDGAAVPVAMISGLAVNGMPVSVSGAQNQVVSLPGLSLVLNEVSSGASGTTVNALHLTSLDGLVNIIVASATAGYSGTSTGGGGSPLPPLPPLPGLGL